MTYAAVVRTCIICICYPGHSLVVVLTAAVVLVVFAYTEFVSDSWVSEEVFIHTLEAAL